MPHPLKQRIHQLRRRVRLMLALYGLSWVVSGVLLATLLLGLVDYLVRFHDPGIRLICSLAILAVFAGTSYRYLCVPLRARLRDVDLARRLERRYPELEDSLASAVEFLDQSEEDPTAGSLALRRAVIIKTTAEAEQIDFGRVLQRRPVQRAVRIAVTITLIAMIVVAADPQSARIATSRLACPFGNIAWPQLTHLALRERVDRVARGQAFELEVIDRNGAKLPEQAHIYYRQMDVNGKEVEQREPMRLLGDSLVARRENITRPFSFRVEGGDDRSMPWIPVTVVDPPAIETLAVELIPPAYTGWPREKTTGHIRVLAGTQVHFTGRATKPLQAATLCLEDGHQHPGRILDDRRTFTVTGLTIERSGAYWFKLTDTEKLTGGTDARWEIHAVPDTAPTVAIEQPTGTVFVTPDAMVPLRVVAKDDQAVARIDLQFSRSDKEGESSVSLYIGSEQLQERASGLSAASELGDSRVVNYPWQLAPLGLSPGLQVTFHATATDYKPLSGQSEPARLAVITREELADRITSRQAFILAELHRVLDMQRQGRQQVAAFEIRVGQIGRLDQLDVDRLQGAELNQRQVNRTLTSRTDGVPMHILGLLAELVNNKVDSPDVQRRMQGLLEEIERLDREHLPAIGRELTAAIKTAQNDLQDSPPPQASSSDSVLNTSLASVGKHQDEVIASLERMLNQLTRWDNYRRFHRELGQLIRSQEDLNRRTLELGQRTLAKELRDLLPQELADLKVAARQQSELARQLDRIFQGMDETAGQLRQTDPLAAGTVTDALDRAKQLAIGATMRSAGDGLEQNRIGQAVEQQKQIVENLQEILDILANRRESELARLTKKLREAQDDLSGLAEREQSLQKQMNETSQHPAPQRRRELERLAAEQEILQKETERMVRRLERLMAQRVAETAGKAAAQMAQAAQTSRQGDGPAAASAAQQAKNTLDDATRQLAQKLRQTEGELAMEQLAQLQDTLQSLQKRQAKALEETRRLDRLRESQGERSLAQAASLFELAREQKSLQSETQALAERLASAEVFQSVLASAAREMSRAGGMLDRRQTGLLTQQAETNSIARLGQLLDALKPDPPEERQNNANSGGGQGGKNRPAQAQVIPDIAQLKLLRMLQEDVNRRTRELDEQARATTPPSPEIRRLAAEISEEQGRLAMLLMNLIQAAEDSQIEDLPNSPESNQEERP